MVRPGFCAYLSTHDSALSTAFQIHQLAFVTPGISPRRLNNRKQILHILKRLRNPLTRPQRGHRLYRLTLNFGSAAALSRKAFRDTSSLRSKSRAARSD